MRNAALVFSALLVASTASAETPSLKGGLQGIDFLVGHWSTPTLVHRIRRKVQVGVARSRSYAGDRQIRRHVLVNQPIGSVH